MKFAEVDKAKELANGRRKAIRIDSHWNWKTELNTEEDRRKFCKG